MAQAMPFQNKTSSGDSFGFGALALKVGGAEAGGRFEAVAEQAIHADVVEPDEGGGQQVRGRKQEPTGG